ncbi:MAG: NADPH-dependent F420 reductase [SAR324 cluster bacterium]|nr:NADPH-dependent F420 reductase [SAR324 cluster bacterium]
MDKKLSTLAILGATGALGKGLALRCTNAGYPVIIGSRSAEKAQKSADELNEQTGLNKVSGLDNRSAAAAAEIVILTVPFSNQRDILEVTREELQGKILVDATVPLMPPKVRTVQLPPEGSAAKAAQEFLGEGVRVVSAFQNVAADHMRDTEHEIDCDILVCGNDSDAREVVVQLIQSIGMRAWHAGRIANSAGTEALTSLLIFINQRYKIDGAGFRITGTPART